MTEPQTKEYLYKALGKMIVEFQGLERSIEHLIFATMTSTHSQVRILMSEMSFKVKVNVMSSLIKDLHSEEETLFDGSNIFHRAEAIVKTCHECEGRRNQLAHSFWIPEFKSAPDLVMRLKESSKSKKGYTYNVESIDFGSLDSDIESIEKARDEINDFCQKLSIQYNRHHGIHGMEGCLENKLIINAIHEAVLAKARNLENENS
nr:MULTISPECIES: hypothetical protein [unclassified Pseudomonas]